MSHRFRLPISSALAVRRLTAEIKRRKAALLTKDESSLSDSLRDVLNAADRILVNVGRARFKPFYLATDADPDPITWNENLDAIGEDLTTAFQEERRIREMSDSVNQAAQVASKEIEQKANLATSQVADLRLTSGQLEQDVIVFGDSFNDLSKIDPAFPSSNPPADIITEYGFACLKRTEINNVVTPDVKVDVTPLAPHQLTRDPTNALNTFRFYEGRFYAPLGDARPEGDSWHIEEKVRPGVQPYEQSSYQIRPPGQQPKGTSFWDQFPDLRREDAEVTRTRRVPGRFDWESFRWIPAHDEQVTDTVTDEREPGFALGPEDIVVVDRGGSLGELQLVRRRMLDSDPNSFWEGEFVVQDSRIQDELDLSEGASADEIAENRVPDAMTPARLRDLAVQIDESLGLDFEIMMMLTLPRRETINVITINPMNFHEQAWLEVVEVSTSSDDDGDGFEPVEGFDSNEFEQVLTDEANAELTEAEASVLMTSNRHSARGQGVFHFAPRAVTRIRLRLRQRIPVPAEYERLCIQLTRTISVTQSISG